MKQLHIAAALLFFLGCSPTVPISEPAASSAGTGTVTLEFVTADGTQTIEVDGVAAGTTLEEVMRGVEQIPITIVGSGTTAFVDKIGRQSTALGNGWMYRIDGEFAHQGIGSTELSPPTTVTWRYGSEPPPSDGPNP